MKKKIALILSVVSLFALLFVLGSCGHEHAFGEAWEKNETEHWHKCNDEKGECTEVSGKEAHKFVERVITAATCSAEGKLEKTCSTCGYKAAPVVIPKIAHTYADATCTTPKTCSVCQATEGEALGHTWEDATCTEAKTCSVCQATDGEALGHTWDDATCTVAKTCSVCQATDGEPLGHTWDNATCTVAKTCSVCQATEGEPNGHTWDNATCTAPKTCSVCQVTEGEPNGHSWDDATCTAPKTCSVCQATEGEALGHTWDDATCTTPKTCSVCQATEGDPLGHTWDDATCTVAKTCSVCQATEGEPNGHSWDDATCTAPKTCSVCQVTEGEPNGHSWDDATCTAPKTCSVCQVTEGDPLGHTWDDATCTAPKTCSVCQATEGAPLGHTWDDATCTTPKTCSVCQATEGEPNGHTWDDATCTVAKTCSVCQATEGEPNGHSWDDATCTTPKTCSVCQVTEGAPLGHTWDEATCTEAKTCSVCQATEGDPLGHTGGSATCTTQKVCERVGCGASYGDLLPHTYYKEDDKVEGTHWETTTAPTCIKLGVGTYKCTVCGNLSKSVEDTFELPVIAHNITENEDYFVSEFVATCCKDGFKTYKCSVDAECNKTEDFKTNSATGIHVYDVVNDVVPPTCSTEGYTVYGCSAGDCGTTENGDFVARTPHSFTPVNDYGVNRCDICSYTYRNVTTIVESGNGTLCFGCEGECTCTVGVEWNGYIAPSAPEAILPNVAFEKSYVAEKDAALAIGNGVIALYGAEDSVYSIAIYVTSEDSTSVAVIEAKGGVCFVDLYKYETVGKVVITASTECTVEFYERIA